MNLGILLGFLLIARGGAVISISCRDPEDLNYCEVRSRTKFIPGKDVPPHCLEYVFEGTFEYLCREPGLLVLEHMRKKYETFLGTATIVEKDSYDDDKSYDVVTWYLD